MRNLIWAALLVPVLTAQTPSAHSFAVATDTVGVSTLDGIVKALYSTISGPKGMKRDIEAQRSLFLSGARMAATYKGKDGVLKLVQMDVDGYCKDSFPVMEARGFFEREVSRKVDQWGHIAQVWSTYESFENETDKMPFERGINTIQLVNDGKRWWVTGISWDSEEPGKPLPTPLSKDRAVLSESEAGSMEAFLQRAVPAWEKGYFERETARKMETWGNMAQVWTTYETRTKADGPVSMRGINGLQMQWDGQRWQIMSIQFKPEDAGTPLPKS